MPAIRVLIVDDHRLVAEAIARLLQTDPELQVVGHATTGPEAIALARLLAPSIVLMDIDLPGMDGVEATWTLRRQFPHLPVMVLTMYSQEAYAVEAIRAGASGYLIKTATADELLSAIHTVSSGQVLYAQAASAALRRAARARFQMPDPFALSRREHQVLQLLVAGGTIRGISRDLVLSPHTVRNHLKGIYRKLGVHGRAEAAVHAVRQGLVKA